MHVTSTKSFYFLTLKADEIIPQTQSLHIPLPPSKDTLSR